MKAMQEKGCTIIFVSHSLNLMAEFCNRILFLEKGRVKFYGSVKEGIHNYESYLLELKEKENRQLMDLDPVDGAEVSSNLSGDNERASFVSCEILDKRNKKKCVFKGEEEMKLRIKLLFKVEINDPHCGFKIVDENGKIAFGTNTYGLNHLHGPAKAGETIQFEFSIKQKLAAGRYAITVGLVNGGHGYPQSFFDETIFYLDDVSIFNIIHDEKIGYWSGPMRIEANCKSSSK